MEVEPKTTDENDDEIKLDLDRRLSVFWLQEALERSLYARFCEENATERALIVHAKRHGAHPNFALLDDQGKLILITVKRVALTESAAKKAEEKILEYAKHERKLGDLAKWYCQHAIDVNSWFEYRGDYCIVTKEHITATGKKAAEGTQFGRLIRMSINDYPGYLAGAEDEGNAMEILRRDYKKIVNRGLIGEANHRIEVGRCIVIANSWPEAFEPKQVDGVTIELWSYPAPWLWVGPGRQRRVEPAS